MPTKNDFVNKSSSYVCVSVAFHLFLIIAIFFMTVVESLTKCKILIGKVSFAMEGVRKLYGNYGAVCFFWIMLPRHPKHFEGFLAKNSVVSLIGSWSCVLRRCLWHSGPSHGINNP